MENTPAQKQFLTPIKIFWAGFFLFLVIALPIYWRNNPSVFNIFPDSSAGVGGASDLLTPPASGVNGAIPQSELPARLKIPALNIDSAVQYVGLTASGNMDTPKSAVDVAWYKLGPAPGMQGSAVIAGHINTRYSAHGVFEYLGNLKTGDKVQVVTQGGKVLTFEVTGKKYLPYTSSANDVFAPTLEKRLNLVTCAGTWQPEKNSYTERLVVYTKLVE